MCFDFPNYSAKHLPGEPRDPLGPGAPCIPFSPSLPGK